MSIAADPLRLPPTAPLRRESSVDPDMTPDGGTRVRTWFIGSALLGTGVLAAALAVLSLGTAEVEPNSVPGTERLGSSLPEFEGTTRSGIPAAGPASAPGPTPAPTQLPTLPAPESIH